MTCNMNHIKATYVVFLTLMTWPGPSIWPEYWPHQRYADIQHFKGWQKLEKLVTFLPDKADGSGTNSKVSEAQLKRKIDSLAHDLFNIDLQIQQIKQQGQHQQQTATLERVKLQIQEEIVAKEIKLEYEKAKRKRWHWVGIFWGTRAFSLPGALY